MYTVADPDPNPRGGGQLPNPIVIGKQNQNNKKS